VAPEFVGSGDERVYDATTLRAHVDTLVASEFVCVMEDSLRSALRRAKTLSAVLLLAAPFAADDDVDGEHADDGNSDDEGTDAQRHARRRDVKSGGSVLTFERTSTSTEAVRQFAETLQHLDTQRELIMLCAAWAHAHAWAHAVLADVVKQAT
jgi:hypothetical protein